MNPWTLALGALFSAAAVATGAFGAHALQSTLSAQARGWYDTAVTYHSIHAIGLLICGLTALHASNDAQLWFNVSAGCFIAGIALFSGSLYIMAFTGITKLGMITPIGGLLLIFAWISLALGSLKITSGIN
ncbi:MAG: DUF423 domain-containing protein [Granulosicoccus sp.]|nr:DUF423 domain-containing protein [Granulosicoccus sp.]